MLVKSLRRSLRALYKQGNFRVKYHPAAVCDTNAQVRAALTKYAVDGKIGVVRSGMDCDCTQYHSEFVMPAPVSVAAFKRWEQQHSESLDGPETMYFRRPQDVEPQHRSRDLALMAYEDGHAHVVHPVGYDQLIPC